MHIIGKGALAFPVPVLPVVAGSLVTQQLGPIDPGILPPEVLYFIIILALVGWSIKHLAFPLAKLLKNGGGFSAVAPEGAVREHLIQEAVESMQQIEVSRVTILAWMRDQDLPAEVRDELETLTFEVQSLKKRLQQLKR